MSYRFEEIAQNWLDQEAIAQEYFEDFVAREGWKSYELDSADPNMKYEELDPACQKCIFRQVQKYNDLIGNDGSSMLNKFTVPCEGIPKNYVSDRILDHLDLDRDSPEAKEIAAARDPVEWAYKNCISEQGTPWEPRWYQKIMLRCTSRRVVFRCGRRVGKSDALAVLALFYCFTKPFYARNPNDGSILLDPKTGEPMQQNTKVLCITPRQTHADNLMNKVLGFLDRNPLLKNSIVSSKKSPYYIIKFSNGSRITCLTAGSGTAGAGMNIRSFDADIIIMDEGNYLGDAELEATKAILMTNVNTMLRISSTPKGIQDFFWEMCNDKPEYKEFHFPSAVLPHWNLTKKNVYADVNTEDEFLHEYMAAFSAASQGVFRMDLVQEAMANFRYDESSPRPGCIYSIGVDWNTNAGTEIFITEVNETTGEYRGVYAENVPKSEWTQLTALEKLLDLVRYWRPEVVCVDEGHGNGAIEILKKYSLQHGKNDPVIFTLRDNLIVYNFSSKIEVADPITGQLVKKHAKPFLVQNSVRRFEERTLSLSMHDKLLKQQLAHYEVVNVSETGIPRYKCTKNDLGDHRLDAFMLSLVGLKLKFGHLDRRSMSVSDTGYIGPRSVERHSRAIPLGRNDFEIELLSKTEFISTPVDNSAHHRYKHIPSRTRGIPGASQSRELKGITNREPLFSRRTGPRRRR
jgi:hypothetical protein